MKPWLSEPSSKPPSAPNMYTCKPVYKITGKTIFAVIPTNPINLTNTAKITSLKKQSTTLF
jgi:hypothetical protein